MLLDLGALTPVGRVYGGQGAPGTTAYMPPELLDDGVVTPAADVFALGTTMRGLLATAPPAQALDDLVARMTSPTATDRPDDDELLVLLHRQLDAVGSSLWPGWATGSLLANLCESHLAVPRRVPADLGRTVLVIGNFDGVHLGHRHVVRRAREIADAQRLRVVAAPSTRTRWRCCGPTRAAHAHRHRPPLRAPGPRPAWTTCS